jgi:hypothetical protein
MYREGLDVESLAYDADLWWDVQAAELAVIDHVQPMPAVGAMALPPPLYCRVDSMSNLPTLRHSIIFLPAETGDDSSHEETG